MRSPNSMMMALASKPVHVMVASAPRATSMRMPEILHMHDAVREEQRVAAAAAHQREHDQPVGRPAHDLAGFPGRGGDEGRPWPSPGAPPRARARRRRLQAHVFGPLAHEQQRQHARQRRTARRSPTSPRASCRPSLIAQGRMYLTARKPPIAPEEYRMDSAMRAPAHEPARQRGLAGDGRAGAHAATHHQAEAEVGAARRNSPRWP